VRAGTLNKRVRIEQRVEVDDDVGEPIPTWTLVTEVWGALEPTKGREFMTEAQLHAEGDGKIRIRYAAGVEEKMRAVIDGVPYDIVSVMDLKTRNREMHLTYIKGLSEG
jgi:SPP1 family predicted phage head-tail adaptor